MLLYFKNELSNSFILRCRPVCNSIKTPQKSSQTELAGKLLSEY
jgi:hypothetical protein